MSYREQNLEGGTLLELAAYLDLPSMLLNYRLDVCQAYVEPHLGAFLYEPDLEDLRQTVVGNSVASIAGGHADVAILGTGCDGDDPASPAFRNKVMKAWFSSMGKLSIFGTSPNFLTTLIRSPHWGLKSVKVLSIPWRTSVS